MSLEKHIYQGGNLKNNDGQWTLKIDSLPGMNDSISIQIPKYPDVDYPNNITFTMRDFKFKDPEEIIKAMNEKVKQIDI